MKSFELYNNSFFNIFSFDLFSSSKINVSPLLFFILLITSLLLNFFIIFRYKEEIKDIFPSLKEIINFLIRSIFDRCSLNMPKYSFL